MKAKPPTTPRRESQNMFDPKRRLRLTFILAAAVIFLVGIVGCGAPAEEEPAPEETDQEEAVAEGVEDVPEEAWTEEEAEVEKEPETEEPSLAVDDWQNPTGISEIVDNFAEMRWTWSRVKNGEETDSSEIYYRYEGRETVNGTETQLLVFAVDGEEYKIWVDENAEAVQAELQGQVVPGQLVDSAIDSVVSTIFWPYWSFEQYGFNKALVQSTPGVDLSIISVENQDFDGSSAEVTRMQVNLSPPAIPEGQAGTATWAVGDFGDLQMLVEWDWTEAVGDGDLAITYSLTKLVPR